MGWIIHSHVLRSANAAAVDSARAVRTWLADDSGDSGTREVCALLLQKVRDELQCECVTLFHLSEASDARTLVGHAYLPEERFDSGVLDLFDASCVVEAVRDGRSVLVTDARRVPDLAVRRNIRNLVVAPVACGGPGGGALLAVNLTDGGDLAVEKDALEEFAALAAPVSRACCGERRDTGREFARLLARLSGRPVWDPATGPAPEADLCRALGVESMGRDSVIALRGVEPGVLRLAAANPFDTVAIADATAHAGAKSCQVLVAAVEDVRTALQALPPAPGDLPLPEAEPEAPAPDEGEDFRMGEFVEALLLEARAAGAEELHVEPGPADTVVRVRVDGICRVLRRIPRPLVRALTGRLKVLANVDITERRHPQNGLIQLDGSHPGLPRRIRLSTLPVIDGERLCLTFAREADAPARLGELGYSPDTFGRYREMLGRKAGVILHVGPGRSGRSTAMYAALRELEKPERVVLTAEHPVLERLPGVLQSEVNPSIGLSFGALVRNLLRQGPDVLMVGRIEDLETLELVLRAALEGRLVLSSMHVPRAVDALVRIRDMGVESYLAAGALVGVVAHRLAPRLCDCKQADSPTTAERDLLTQTLGGSPPARVWRRAGCDRCARTGTRGRVGVHEVLDPAVLFDDGSSRWLTAEEYRDRARARGMRSLFEDALSKVVSGLLALPDALGLDMK